MPPARDKRRRTDLDLFILALVERGVHTPYDLQRTAGLSQGAMVPALQRLVTSGLIRSGEPGMRRRTEYRITPKGKRALQDGWMPLLENGPTGDLDADLRIALLAYAQGERKLALAFLSQAADQRTAAASQDSAVSAEDFPALAHEYARLRKLAARVRLSNEADILRTLISSFPQVGPRHSQAKS